MVLDTPAWVAYAAAVDAANLQAGNWRTQLKDIGNDLWLVDLWSDELAHLATHVTGWAQLPDSPPEAAAHAAWFLARITDIDGLKTHQRSDMQVAIDYRAYIDTEDRTDQPALRARLKDEAMLRGYWQRWQRDTIPHLVDGAQWWLDNRDPLDVSAIFWRDQLPVFAHATAAATYAWNQTLTLAVEAGVIDG